MSERPREKKPAWLQTHAAKKRRRADRREQDRLRKLRRHDEAAYVDQPIEPISRAGGDF